MPRLPLLAGVCALFAACAIISPKYEKPHLSVVAIDVLGGTLFQQNIRITLQIDNPNDRVLPVEGITAELHVGGQQIASGASTHSFVVPASGTTQFDLMVTANLALGLLNLAKNMQSDAVDYDLSGVIRLDLPLFRSLPFHQSGTFSLRNSPH